MKEKTKIFLYFVIVAPILTKILEWLLQWATFGGWSHLAHGVWILQLIFIEFIALCIYGIMDWQDKFKGVNVAYIPGIAYLIKELYNFFFVYGMAVNLSSVIAIFVEPVIMLFLLGWAPYHFFFEKGGRR